MGSDVWSNNGRYGDSGDGGSADVARADELGGGDGGGSRSDVGGCYGRGGVKMVVVVLLGVVGSLVVAERRV